MTPREFEDRMREIPTGDIEISHSLADDLVCECLRSLGYGAGVDVYEKMEKWYA